MLEEILAELRETWDYTPEEINHIKEKLKDFAMACVTDKKVFEELITSE